MGEEIADLREAVQSLAARVSALESSRVARSAEATSVPAEGDAFWALTELQSRLPDDPSTVGGAVMMVGSLTLPTGAPVAWQQGIGAEGLLESDWGERSQVLAALGHPVRLELLRHVLAGVHATADLGAIESLGTTGQLHHHLRQLVATGWVRQSGRGTYEVPAARVVPLMICMLGAER
ncbi:ArsR/SmtB family transcription factor [Microbacterium sp. A196]|uniref:ArsR/SmtB family transcription factor n=1 Tax=unclassified Microbacterium TaxID=2609290 RepID=UPI003FD07421